MRGTEKRMRDHVGPAIRLMALTKNDDGTLSVFDIVETIPHFAYGFAKHFMRNPDVCAFVVTTVGSTLPPVEWKRA